jgi:hypothetical protein
LRLNKNATCIMHHKECQLRFTSRGSLNNGDFR